MKKAIAIIVLGLVLVGCAPTASDTKFIGNTTHKYYVSWDPIIGASDSEIKATADQKCASIDEGHAINLTKGKVMIGSVILFDCSDTELKKQKVIAQKKASEELKIQNEILRAQTTCLKIGFKSDTDPFANCTLQILTTERQIKEQEALNQAALSAAEAQAKAAQVQLGLQQLGMAAGIFNQSLSSGTSTTNTQSSFNCRVRGTGSMRYVDCW